MPFTHADAPPTPTVSITITNVDQDPGNPVPPGGTVKYTVTVNNPNTSSVTAVIGMSNGADSADFLLRTGSDCSFDTGPALGAWNCGQMTAGQTKSFDFGLISSVESDFSFTVGGVACAATMCEGPGSTVEVTMEVAQNLTNAVDDGATTAQDTPVDIDVLANDTGTDGQSISGPEITDDPSNGSVDVNSDDTVTYTPSGGFEGTDNFVYSIESGGISDDATVTVTVGSSQGPIAVDDEADTLANQAITIDVLNNDTGREGLAVSLVEVTSSPRAGSANENPDGTITYTPTSGFSGTDSFTYTMTDDGVAQDTAEVTVYVRPSLPI